MQGLQAASWPDAFEAIKKGLEGAQRNEIAAVAGKLADAESMVALKVPPPPSWLQRLWGLVCAQQLRMA